jgi:uncharacterized 2Fe-2S/4Fe-4S cluster protein (DUF4445 family)
MPKKIQIRLAPLGESLEVTQGTPLQDVLFKYGVEFPCGGVGICRGCRVRVLEGHFPPTLEMEETLTQEEIAAGWRLACQGCADSPLELEIAQWETPILSDDTHFDFEPDVGLGIAIDLGTTTLVVQLVDLSTGQVLSVQTALNPQAAHGADVMSRIEFALAEGNVTNGKLTGEIRRCLYAMIQEAFRLARLSPENLRHVMIVGNTVMHHLFCGIDVEPLSHVPFEPKNDGLISLTARELDWTEFGAAKIHFLPCLGGFVGSDVLAGIIATGMAESTELVALADLGTNGEIVVGDRSGLICASTAAGPAFEAGRIRMGMRASAGAITGVSLRNGKFHYHVLGDGQARGICGSGLVDAAAAGLNLGLLQSNGRFSNGSREWMLVPPVSLSQGDIRELQLAKGAIAAGLRILLDQFGKSLQDLHKLHLAGAFGNYVNRESARRIGLIEVSPGKIHSAGNTALRGAKMVLLSNSLFNKKMEEARRISHHLSLASDQKFHATFVESMNFPETNATITKK